MPSFAVRTPILANGRGAILFLVSDGADTASERRLVPAIAEFRCYNKGLSGTISASLETSCLMSPFHLTIIKIDTVGVVIIWVQFRAIAMARLTVIGRRLVDITAIVALASVYVIGLSVGTVRSRVTTQLPNQLPAETTISRGIRRYSKSKR